MGYVWRFPVRPSMKAAKPPASFEAALQELEALVQRLENGNAPLEEALAAYERGRLLLDHCEATLAQAEQKIRLLDAQGRLKEFSPSTPAGEAS